jgi:hypothetical protein
MKTGGGCISYPPLEGEGRVALREAQRNPGWGEQRRERMNISPHPDVHRKAMLCSERRPSPSRGG